MGFILFLGFYLLLYFFLFKYIDNNICLLYICIILLNIDLRLYIIWNRRKYVRLVFEGYLFVSDVY